jgi:DNA end-binding protein Ku
MAARSIWNGTLTFSEVAIPVKLYAAVEQRRIRFREVRISDGSRISHKRFGVESGEEVPSDQIGFAYEAKPGQSLTFTSDELATTSQTPPKTFEVDAFVPSKEIDPIYYDRPYILGPQPGGEHAYRVLHDALKRRQSVGIGRFVLRSREHLAAVMAYDDSLRLFTMHFADELVKRPELDVPSLPAAPAARELALAKTLIDTFAQTWEPERHEDHYRDEVMKLIEAKAGGSEIKAPSEPVQKPAPDLMDALKASIEERKSDGAAPRRRRAPSKSAATKSAPKRRAGTSQAKTAAKPKANKPKAKTPAATPKARKS